MKKAFTLIELLVVIGVLTILFGMGMNFGNSRITQLKAQTMKERFVGNYTSLLDQRLISSYQGTLRYRELKVSFGSGVFYSFDNGAITSLFPLNQSMQLSGLSLDGNMLDNFVLTALPYRLSCVPSLSGDVFTFRLRSLWVDYCFSIDIATCRLRETTCIVK